MVFSTAFGRGPQAGSIKYIRRHAQGPLISPQGRRVIAFLCASEALALLLLGVFQNTFSPLIGMGLVTIGSLLALFSSAPSRCYYTPLVFTLWFHLGCVLSFADLILNEALFRSHPNPATAAFAFTDGEMWLATVYLAAGAAAIVLLTLFAERFIARDIPGRARSFRDAGIAANAVVMWTVISLILAVVLIYLQIGRTGLVNKTELPFHLAGVLSFSRSYVVPALGLLIVDLLMNGRHGLILKAMFGAFFLVGMAGSISALSRGYLGFVVIALSIYFIVNLGRHQVNLRSFVYWVVGAVPLLLLAIFLVNSLREKGFSGHELSLPSVLSMLMESRLTDLGLIFTDFFNLAVGRIGGLQELLGTLSAPHVWDSWNPWLLFTENVDAMAWLQRSVLGFMTYSDATVGFGYSYSLWGSLSLGGSLWHVILGTGAYLLALLLMEECFFRLNLSAVALSLAVNVGFQFWGFANKTICMNLFGIIAIIYVIGRFAFQPGRWIREGAR